MDIDEGEIEFKNIKDYIEDQGYMFKDLGEGSSVANFEKSLDYNDDDDVYKNFGTIEIKIKFNKANTSRNSSGTGKRIIKRKKTTRRNKKTKKTKK